MQEDKKLQKSLDLLLYGNYFEMEGQRVEPTKVKVVCKALETVRNELDQKMYLCEP